MYYLYVGEKMKKNFEVCSTKGCMNYPYYYHAGLDIVLCAECSANPVFHDAVLEYIDKKELENKK